MTLSTKAQIEKAKDRARKLLNLSQNNTNENESQNAFLKAQEILLEAGMTIEEFKNINEEDKEKKIEEVIKSQERPATDFIAIQGWHRDLARVIAKNFRCIFWLDTRWEDSKKRIMFFGLQADIDFARDVYVYAMRSIENCATHYMLTRTDLQRSEKKAVKNTYMDAYIKGLDSKFKKQVVEKGYQLAIIPHALVTKQYEERSVGFTKAKASTARRANDSAARNAGFEQGKNLDLAMGRRTIR